MQKKGLSLGRILKAGFIPNLINDALCLNDALCPMRLAEAVRAAGIQAMEISCRRPDTLAVLKKLKNKFPDMSFGISSLIEKGPYYDFLQKRGPRFPSVKEAAENGADFLVSMIAFDAETYQRHKDTPIMPGVETPGEAKIHLDYGASLVKFSAPELREGPAYFRMINGGPMHFGLPLLLSGGLRPELIDKYVAVGMLAAVAGFDLILGGNYAAMQSKPDWEEATKRLCAYTKAFAAARAKHMPEVNFDSSDPLLIQQQSGKFINA